MLTRTVGAFISIQFAAFIFLVPTGQVRELKHTALPVLILIEKLDSDVNYIAQIASSAAQWDGETISRRHVSSTAAAELILQRCTSADKERTEVEAQTEAAKASRTMRAQERSAPSPAAASTATKGAAMTTTTTTTTASAAASTRTGTRFGGHTLTAPRGGLQTTPVADSEAGMASIRAVAEIFRGRDDKPSVVRKPILFYFSNCPTGPAFRYPGKDESLG